MAVNIDLFKTGMRQLVSGVSIITAMDAEKRRFGFTATAVCSVSADPPTLLVCANRGNGSCQTIKDSGFFVVNVLALSDQYLSDRFAGRMGPEERFLEGSWTESEEGTPVLSTSLVSFSCQLSEVVDVASHSILFGEVLSIQLGEDQASALLYGQGSYGKFIR
jgi:flavin reductase (DIM6/NTAB) family NADH-FMN oxidoreductase RutF